MAPSPARYLAINDFADAIQAFPQDLVRQFTLLKEIDAKCASAQAELDARIKAYLEELESLLAKEKTSRLEAIKALFVANYPCYEEKMTIANLATDMVAKHMERINGNFEMIAENEIPKVVKYGPKTHPAVMPDSKLPDNKTAQSQRSESRREAIAAKKAQGEPPKGRAPTPGARRKRPEPQKEEEDRKRQKPKKTGAMGLYMGNKEEEEEGTNEVYCVCQQVLFGEMIACDNVKCKIQWFHLQCVGLAHPPKGTWYCDECKREYGLR